MYSSKQFLLENIKLLPKNSNKFKFLVDQLNQEPKAISITQTRLNVKNYIAILGVNLYLI